MAAVDVLSQGSVAPGRAQRNTSAAAQPERCLRFPIVRNVRSRSHDQQKLVVESVAYGCGYTAVLIWAGTALVASFTSGE
jgi:hypothetical protein